MVGTPPRARLRTTPRPLSSAPTTTAHGLSLITVSFVLCPRRLAYFVCKHRHSDDAANTPSLAELAETSLPGAADRNAREPFSAVWLLRASGLVVHGCRSFSGNADAPESCCRDAFMNSRSHDVLSRQCGIA